MATLFRRTFATFRSLNWTMDPTHLPGIFHPPVNRNMKELDRSFFKKLVPTSALSITDPKQISKARTAMAQSRELLQLTGIKPIIDDDQELGAKVIILKPMIKADQPATWSFQLRELVESRVAKVRPYDLHLSYENWSMFSILEAILPESDDDDRDTPSGFAQAGHIAHVNLRSQYLPYKNIIGQVLLDKNPVVRTVINKTLDVGSDSKFRTFPYEILAGDNDLEVHVSEQNCEFSFNFAEVYWNSRLSREHERLVAKFEQGEAVCDVMAGVGPFAVPAGKNKVFVRANDLNPHSYEGLVWAIKRNKVGGFVSASCMDGREFIKLATNAIAEFPRTYERMPPMRIPRNANFTVMEKIAADRIRRTSIHEEPRCFSHYVMNLPATAVEFLDAFTGLFEGREDEFKPITVRPLPMIHVYTFQTRRDTGEEEVEEVCEKVSKYLGAQIKPTDKDVDIFDARLVAPKKKYYCASFRLPAEVAFARRPWMINDQLRDDQKSIVRELGVSSNIYNI